MNFWKQLKLLLWKNITLRKRQPIRFVIEIIWPIVLLALLALVRTRNLQVGVPECHFDEKALPSAGILPLLQSYICAFNNTCRPNSTDDVYGTVNMYHDSIISRIFQVLEEVLGNQTLQQSTASSVNNAAQLIRVSQELADKAQFVPTDSLKFRDIFNISTQDLAELLKDSRSAKTLLNLEFRPFVLSDVTQFLLGNQLFCDIGRLKKVFVFANGTDIAKLSHMLCNVPSSTWLAVLGPTTNFATISSHFRFQETDIMFFGKAFEARSLINDLSKSLKELTQFQQLTSEVQTIYNSTNSTGIQFIGKFICGKNAGIFNLQQKPNSMIQKLREQQLTGNNVPFREVVAKYSNETSPLCSRIFDYFDKNTQIGIRFLWKPLKSFVMGKLLYTPDTPATRKVIKRMNQTFESIDGLLWTGRQISRMLPEITILLDAIGGSSSISNNSKVSVSRAVEIMSNFLTSQGWDGLLPVLQSGMGSFSSNSNTITDLKDYLNTLGEMIGNVTELMGCVDLDKFVPVADEPELNLQGTDMVDNDTFWAGIVFENVAKKASRNEDKLPTYIRYKIRYDVEKVDSTGRVQDRFWRPHPRRNPITDLKYWTYGFVQLQDMIERAIMGELLNTTESLPGLYLQQFPYPCYIEDSFFMAISRNFPLLMTLAWVYTASMTVKSIVYEKEKRLRETMLMMGLSNGANWMSWFLETFVIMHISIIFMVIILVYGQILMHSGAFIIYVFLLSFCLATIAFSFLLSVFFSKANIAAAAGGIIFFCTFLPYSLLVLWEDRITLVAKLFSCLIPNVAFGWGSNIFARYEEQGVGVHFQNFAKSPMDGDKFNLAHSIIMLLGDAVLLFIFSWYFEAVMPGQFGIPRPWYFPVTSSYWFGSRSIKKQHGTEEESEDVDVKADGENFEHEPSNLERGVEINNLRKVYDNGKIAVDGLSLNVFEGITALLGHNGAGKTTTFSILCGLFPPTSGSAKIYGCNVKTEMDEIRKNFGFCPQHNILWDELTVEEHLQFYASLKLADPAAVEMEIDAMLKHVGLPHKRKERTCNLSGGMQRKLSVAIAYIGGAKVVLLDEPTAGVDPWARRGIWNLMIKFRKERTTIMSTHFHGEADILADRIAVIADGKLICGGSPVFLKSRFGNGYYLTLVKNQPETNVEGLSRFIQTYIPEALLVENVGSEVAYVLPTTASRDGRFEKLFEAMDANIGFLDISSYGVRDTSLEEVFLRVMETHDHIKPPENDVATTVTQEGFLARTRRRLSHPSGPGDPLDNSVPVISTNVVTPVLDDWDKINLATKRLHGSSLICQQMKAMHIKRFHNLRRSKKSFFCEILLPAVFVCLAMVVTLLTPVPLEQPALELTPWLYGPPNYVFFLNDRPENSNNSAMIKHLYEGPGIGTRCIKDDPVYGKPCASSIRTNVSQLMPDLPVSRNASVQCSCEAGGQQCPEDAGGPTPPCMLLNTTDWLCNMTGRNISDWLVKTSRQYDRSRYGGFSFGEVDSFARFNFTRWVETLNVIMQQANVTEAGTKEGLSGRWADFVLLMSQMFQGENIKVWFNNRGWAASVSYVNAINNVILRSRLKPDQDPFQYGITAINHPLNRTEEQMDDQIAKESAKALLHAVCVIFAMSFVPASFVMFLIEERVSGAKNLQFTAKVKPWLYWISTYTWDICSYVITALICVLIFVSFNEQAYVSRTNAPALISLLLLYGFAAIPMMYIPSFFFKVPSSAFVALACLNLFLGIVTTITVFILELLDDQELQDISVILRQVFLIFPHYCLGRGLMDLAINNVKATVYARFGQTIEDRPFEWTFVGRNLTCMIFQGIIFFAITILIEYRFFYKPKHILPEGMVQHSEDKDVTKERLRVQNRLADGSVLKVSALTKAFRKQNRVQLAVDNISFAIGKGECFGLLGVNGAGKTTTFKMLTGNLQPSSGDATVNGHSVVTDLDTARQYIGYCPQFDAIHQLLTGREHLEFYARIHGIPENYIKKAAERGIQRLQLSAYASRTAGGYSGGNKRKLSTAIALIGDPDIIFLDEPTTGMDPKARRFLWNCILSMIREGRSVTLTSHSLEECENLCTKLAIMVNGRFQCFGSLQHLKSRFGFGYSVIIRCSPNSMDKVCQFVEETFHGARMQEKHYNTVQYRVPLRSVKLSQIFGAIERNRETLQIEDASVNQTNLEDIFIEFAKHQTDLASDEIIPEGPVIDGPVADSVSLASSPYYRSSVLQMDLDDVSNKSNRVSATDIFVTPIDPEPESTHL